MYGVSTLLNRLERKLPKDVLANIRKEFKFDMEEKKICCTVGDGVTAIFCLRAMYRPSGMVCREIIKDKMAATVSKFSAGSCPAHQVKEVTATLQEAMDLGVPLQWSRIGRPIVTALTERNNIFARSLTEFSILTNIGDLEDSDVMIARMFFAITQACVELEQAGISPKRALYVGYTDDS